MTSHEKLRKLTNIEEIKYENGVNHYRLNTGQDTFWGVVNKYTANWISSKFNKEIIPAVKLSCALNYTPQAIKNNIMIH